MQHQPLRGLDSLVIARFVHGYAIIHKTTNNQSAADGDVEAVELLFLGTYPTILGWLLFNLESICSL